MAAPKPAIQVCSRFARPLTLKIFTRQLRISWKLFPIPKNQNDMALKYGFLKCKIVSDTRLKSTKRRNEIQYHLHADCSVASQNGDEIWDAAINVGTDDADDLLRYRLAFNYSHAILSDLRNAPAGLTDLTGTS